MITKKIPEIGYEVTKITKHGITFRGIKEPKGWHIPNLEEAGMLLNNEKFKEFTECMNTKNDFWVKGIKEFPVARFVASSVGVVLGCGRGPGCPDPQLGVLFIKKLEGEEK